MTALLALGIVLSNIVTDVNASIVSLQSHAPRLFLLKHWLQLGCKPVTGPVMRPNKLFNLLVFTLVSRLCTILIIRMKCGGFYCVMDVGTEAGLSYAT